MFNPVLEGVLQKLKVSRSTNATHIKTDKSVYVNINAANAEAGLNILRQREYNYLKTEPSKVQHNSQWILGVWKRRSIKQFSIWLLVSSNRENNE